MGYERDSCIYRFKDEMNSLDIIILGAPLVSGSVT
jgi:hypothetical protein